jgi:hypothetical protein
MSDVGVFQVLADVGAIAAAITAVFAAFAAFRSARAAETTAKNAALAEKRRLLREIMSNAQGAADEAHAIDVLVPDLKDLHATYLALTGTNLEGSVRNHFIAELEEKLSPVASIKDHAQGFANDYPGLSTASEDDLSIAQAKVVADLAQVHRIGDEMRWRRDDLSRKCAAQREHVLRRSDPVAR